MAEAYLVEAVRTPVGRRNGGLSTIHSADLGAHVLKGLMDRSGVDPNAVDDVVFGCCDTIGSQAGDIARSCWLAADLPMHVPGVTIDRQCGSSQQSVHFAAQAVMSGTSDLVVAGGVQNMSAIPISSAMTVGEQFGFETPFSGSTGWEARFGDQEISQFNGAEMMVKKWDIQREELDELAVNSHLRAIKATEEGRFKNEILPINESISTPERVDACRRAGIEHDEGMREPNREKMASLQPLVEGGSLTAAHASQISDGATAILVASEQAVKDHGLTPRARVHHISVLADDPPRPFPSTPIWTLES